MHSIIFYNHRDCNSPYATFPFSVPDAFRYNIYIYRRGERERERERERVSDGVLWISPHITNLLNRSIIAICTITHNHNIKNKLGLDYGSCPHISATHKTRLHSYSFIMTHIVCNCTLTSMSRYYIPICNQEDGNNPHTQLSNRHLLQTYTILVGSLYYIIIFIMVNCS